MKRSLRQVALAVADLVPRRRSAPLKRGSHEFRTNADLILRGRIPPKYARLIDLVPGDRVLEVGAAEGVLALLLACRKQQVIALDKNEDRLKWARRLQAHWQGRGVDVSRCRMVHGDLREHLDLLEAVDTLVAIRMIYYLHEDVWRVFEHVGRHVPNVVLCGNQWRAERSRCPDYAPVKRDDHFNRFASVEGMTELLETCGYSIARTVPDGDPIVVGVKRIP